MSLLLAICGAACGAARPHVEQAPVAMVSFAPVIWLATPAGYHEASVGAWKLTLMEPDDLTKPTAWQGPLRVRNSERGTECEITSSIVRSVSIDPNSEQAVVVSFSGSNTTVEIFEMNRCERRGPAVTRAVGGVEVRGSKVHLQSACECPAAKVNCRCTDAGVYTITRRDGLKLDTPSPAR